VAKIKEKKSEPTKLSTKHECSIVANALRIVIGRKNKKEITFE